MPKAEWGVKRICPTTGKRFYDLNKSPVISPYTGDVVDIESASRRASAPSLATAIPEKIKKRPAPALDDDELLVDDDTADVESDDDLLEDDEDDNVSLDDLTDVAGDDDD